MREISQDVQVFQGVGYKNLSIEKFILKTQFQFYYLQTLI